MTEGYGQYCPLAKGAEVFAERWTPLILRELLRGSTTFNDLHRGVPRMSRSLLSGRLRKLESCGVVKRSERTGGTDYHLTPAGRELGAVVTQLGTWAQRWFRSTFREHELDAGVHARIELVLPEGGTKPPLRPGPKLGDHRPELPAGGGQMVVGATGALASLHHATRFELSQPAAEERPRHGRHASMQVIE